MKIPLYQVDAFTGRLFGGNPAAVCPLEAWLKDSLLQAIAAENNLSETAFFIKNAGFFELRWFTPLAEVDLCGHATLASAYVIMNCLEFSGEEVEFQTRSGMLKVRRKGDLLAMDFPSRKPLPARAPAKLLEGLGLEPLAVLKSRDYMAVLEGEEQVLAVSPDFRALSELDCTGIIITAPGRRSDFVSRFFAPAVGIPEDPVTGSSHCSLVPYWSEKLNKKVLHAFQLSQRRGELFCEDLGERVLVAGKAVIYCVGEIYLE